MPRNIRKVEDILIEPGLFSLGGKKKVIQLDPDRNRRPLDTFAGDPM